MQWTGTPYTATRKRKPTVLGTGMKKAQGIMGAQKEETDLGQEEERLEVGQRDVRKAKNVSIRRPRDGNSYSVVQKYAYKWGGVTSQRIDGPWCLGFLRTGGP